MRLEGCCQEPTHLRELVGGVGAVWDAHRSEVLVRVLGRHGAAERDAVPDVATAPPYVRRPRCLDHVDPACTAAGVDRARHAQHQQRELGAVGRETGARLRSCLLGAVGRISARLSFLGVGPGTRRRRRTNTLVISILAKLQVVRQWPAAALVDARSSSVAQPPRLVHLASSVEHCAMQLVVDVLAVKEQERRKADNGQAHKTGGGVPAASHEEGVTVRTERGNPRYCCDTAVTAGSKLARRGSAPSRLHPDLKPQIFY